MRTVAFVTDLMDKSRIANHVDFARVANKPDLSDADLVIIDLDKVDVGEVAKLMGFDSKKCLGFGSHVNREVLDLAKSAGLANVMPRSEFFGDLERWLASAD